MTICLDRLRKGHRKRNIHNFALIFSVRRMRSRYRRWRSWGLWGLSLNKHFGRCNPTKIAKHVYVCIACHLATPPKTAQKTEVCALLHILRFFGLLHGLNGGLHDFQFFFVQSVEHGVNPLSAFAPFILGRIEILIYRYIEHCHHLIKGIEAGGADRHSRYT